MITMSFPTQGIVEKCLIDVFGKLSKVIGFPTLSKGCLTPSIKTIGTIPECHFCPGTYGVLSKSVPTLTGVDIPILVRADEEPHKTVAIVAQDPLRDPKTLPSHHHKKVIVGTPFAYHNDVLCCPQTLVYRKIIQGLLNKGYNVYVTDIWKCWDKYKTYRGTCDIYQRPRIFFSYPLVIIKVIIIFAIIIILIKAGKNE